MSQSVEGANVVFMVTVAEPRLVMHRYSSEKRRHTILTVFCYEKNRNHEKNHED